MKLGKFTLTEWKRSYGGWSRYNIDYIEHPLAVHIYHNLIETMENTPDCQLPENATYDPSRKIIWTIKFSHLIHELTQLYYDLYEPQEFNEDEMKIVIDKFIIRIDKLIIFS